MYVHLPFCAVQCPFCDFYTRPDGDPNEKRGYVDSVLAEIALHERLGFAAGREIATLYFGGGTPSLTATDDLARVIEALRRRFRFVSDAEITLEANPEDVALERARAWIDLGVNRFSLGVQATRDAELARLGRNHRAAHNGRAVDNLRAAGATNVSVDLMFGLEGQALGDWLDTLRTVTAWDPAHVSCYNLTVEEKTRYAVEQKQGKLVLPADDAQAAMFLEGRARLAELGWPAYEVSNFAKPGFASRHNRAYWDGVDYWGIGVSAHSFRRGPEGFRRFWHPRSLAAYRDAILAGETAVEEETLAPGKHLGERLMTALRQAAGVDLAALEADVGCATPAAIRESLARWLDEGLLAAAGGRLALTSRGLLVSDSLFVELF